MVATLMWNGDELLKLLDRQVAAGLKTMGAELQRIARTAASVPNPRTYVKVQRRTKGGNKRTRTVYLQSSKPGEPPRRRTGFGQKSILSEFNRKAMEARVGYSRMARYMMFHELGIHYRNVGLKKRPTILPALYRNWARLNTVALNAAKAAK